MNDLQIESFLRKHPWFSNEEDSVVLEWSSQWSYEEFQLGDTVISSGDLPLSLYCIYEGSVRILDVISSQESITLDKLGVQNFFGVGEILERREYRHTIRAISNLTVVKWPRSHFEKWLLRHPQLHEALRLKEEIKDKAYFLRRLPFFRKWPLDQIQSLLNRLPLQIIEAGTVLFEAGQEAASAYLIYQGKLQTYPKDQPSVSLLSGGVGDLLGEEAFVPQSVYQVTAVAKSSVEAFVLSSSFVNVFPSQKEGFDDALQTYLYPRHLQQKTLLLSQQTAGEESILSKPSFKRGFGTYRRSLWTRRYPTVKVESPWLAGVACIAMLDSFFHKKRSLQELIDQQTRFETSDTLRTLSQKLEQQGYITRSLHLSIDQMPSLSAPFVVELFGGLLAVVYQVTPEEIVLADPFTGIEQIPLKKIEKIWGGKALTLNPSVNFQDTKTVKKLGKQLFQMAEPYWFLMGWIVGVSLLVQLLGLIAPLFTSVIIDRILPSGDFSFLGLIAFGMLWVAGFQMAGLSLREWMITHAIRRISASVLVQFFKHVMALRQAVFYQWSVGDFIARFQESEKFLRLVSHSGYQTLVDSLSVFIYLGTLFFLHPKLAVIALLLTLIYGVLVLIASPILRQNDRIIFQNRKTVESYLIEMISNIESVKAMAIEKKSTEEGNDLLAQLKKSEFRGALLSLNLQLIGQFIRSGSMVFVLIYGATLTWKGEISMGELIAFQAVLGLLLGPLNGLLEVWDEWQEIQVSFERIHDILSLPPEQSSPLPELPELEGRIRFDQVEVCYHPDAEAAITQLNLEILPKETVALVGRSGSGKTTIANLILKLADPSKGKVFIDFRDLEKSDVLSLRRQVGIVEQTIFLFHGTIRDNIAKSNPDLPLSAIVTAAKRADAHDFIMALPQGYDTLLQERGVNLSGGQRQRITLARAIVNDPKILILDEATSALDMETEGRIHKNMEEFIRQRTTLIITHRLSALRLVQRILVLDHGQLVESGSHEELLQKKGLYYQLYQARDVS